MLLSFAKKHLPAFLFTSRTLIIGKLDSPEKSFEIYEEFPLPENAFLGNEIKDLVKFTQFIKNCADKTKLKNTKVIIGIPEDKCFTHTLTLPPLETKEISQAISYQADTFLPFPYSKEYLDWKLIEKLPDNRKKVLVGAIPKDIIDSLISVFESVNLFPIAFETASITLFRKVPKDDRNSSLAVNFSENSTLIISCYKGSIDTNVVISEKNDFLPTIKKLLTYLSSKDTSVKFANIYLSGKTQGQETLLKELTSLGIKPIFLKTGLKGIPPEKEPEIVLISSLIKKDILPPIDDRTINILPESQINKYFSKSLSVIEKYVKVICLIILALITFYLIFKFIGNREDKEALNSQKELLELKPLTKEEVVRLKLGADLIFKTEKEDKAILRVLEIAAKLPSAIQITGVRYEKDLNELSLFGIALKRDDLLNFKNALEKEKQFSSVTIPITSLQKDKNVDFKIIININ